MVGQERPLWGGAISGKTWMGKGVKCVSERKIFHRRGAVSVKTLQVWLYSWHAMSGMAISGSIVIKEENRGMK